MRSLLFSPPFLLALLQSRSTCNAFAPQRLPSFQSTSTRTTTTRTTTTTTTTELFLMDFFKQAAEDATEQFNTIAEGLTKSRTRFLQDMELLFTGQSDDVLEELEDVLLQADLGLATSEEIIKEVKSLQEAGQMMRSRQDLLSVMRGVMVEGLDSGKPGAISFSQDESLPTILFIMGANGMGKTTTIGKLAHRLKTEGDQKVLMAACDTFRAGAVDQLQMWADRAEVDCYRPSEGKKTPAAVLYGALDKALAENYDTVLVDTSGRLSNNDALTQELVKMKKVIQKRLSQESDAEGKPILNENVPHDTLLVLDAAQGRMALDSAKTWDEEIGLSGLILTKLDGSARGGSIVAVSRELKLPVKLIGVGEGMNDLRDFEPVAFVEGLLGIGAGIGGKSEGKELESRLKDMRKQRDNQAKEAKKQEAAVASAMPSMSNGEGMTPFQFDDEDDDEIELVSVTEPTSTRSGRFVPSKSNKKKKKKKK